MNGSSPLTRGAQQSAEEPPEEIRLIPAHAGSTGWRELRGILSAAHPRSRGEHRLTFTHMIPGLGSSPLTQGALIHCLSRRLHLRLIPAHAGSTNASRATTTEVSAHPRSRGEHRRGRIFRPCECGSSPLTRGARDGIRHGIPPWRLIPARAGNIPRRSAVSPPSPAHPRSRGEHRTRSMKKSHGKGSSPLTRGTRSGLRRVILTPRLIPARAGNTTRKALRTAMSAAHPRSRGEHFCCVQLVV